MAIDAARTTGTTVWRPTNGDQIQRAAAAKVRDDLRADRAEFIAQRAPMKAHYDTVVVPAMRQADKDRVKGAWIAGITTAVALGGVAGFVFGMAKHDFPAGAIVGVVAGAAGGLLVGGINSRPGGYEYLLPHDVLDDKVEWEETIRNGFPQQGDLSRAEHWDPSSTSGAHVYEMVERDIAPFDHDRDGVIDLHAGSSEMRRDVAGGPVRASTADVVDLADPYVGGDTNGDNRLTPAEAVAAAVRWSIED